MQQPQKRLIIANTFGTLGYISTLFQWLWSFLILIYPLLIAQPDFLFPAEQPNFTHNDPQVAVSPLTVAIAIAASVAILAVTIVVLLRLPSTIARKGAQFTRSTAKTVVPVVMHHKKITKKQRVQLSYRIILIIKLLLVIAPLVALVFAKSIEQIDSEVVWAMALFCATCSISYFLVQQLVARLTRIDVDKLW